MKLILISSYPAFRGSAIARIIGLNAQKLQRFATSVKMWVYEENINGRKLTDIINTEHENVKYLPGYKLPENVVRTICYLISNIFFFTAMVLVQFVPQSNKVEYTLFKLVIADQCRL